MSICYGFAVFYSICIGFISVYDIFFNRILNIRTVFFFRKACIFYGKCTVSVIGYGRDDSYNLVIGIITLHKVYHARIFCGCRSDTVLIITVNPIFCNTYINRLRCMSINQCFTVLYGFGTRSIACYTIFF